MKLQDALKAFASENSQSDTSKICPISKETIRTEYKLPCGHSFEYSYLYHELYRQTKDTKTHTSKCPYCRYNLKWTFLPYIACIDETTGETMKYDHPFYLKLKNGILSTHDQCSYVCQSGKNKGKTCENIAHKFSFGNYCSKHYTTQYKKSLRKPCCAITKSGKPCCKYVNEKIENNTKFCTLHAKMGLE